jgi:hypothetical protein
MQDLLKDHLVENTDGEMLFFTLTCAVCGKVWKSTPIPNQGDRESRLAARKHAVAEAAQRSHMCPFCGQPVCEACFVNVEGITLCVKCARRLQERIDEK